nr:MAG TPA: hypothetical protein [Caudoviricetes sp.]
MLFIFVLITKDNKRRGLLVEASVSPNTASQHK